jgi:hypothetical protein
VKFEALVELSRKAEGMIPKLALGYHTRDKKQDLIFGAKYFKKQAATQKLR